MIRTMSRENLLWGFKKALAELVRRSAEIDEQLTRLEAMQGEKEMIRKQIDALNSALQSFTR